MDDDFHSLNKGVFVIPFDPARGTTSGAGPSKPRPLQPVYDESFSRFEDEYERYEATRTSEQLDEVDDWLERCDAPPTIKQAFPIRRLPLALTQNISPSFVRALRAARGRPVTINGRDMGDLAAATRAVAVAYLGEAALVAKKAGRTPIDEVERCWSGLDDGRPPLLVHVQQAQLIPSAVLAELIYILTLHHTVPFRLLLSVPSISIFMSKWTLLEPSEVDLSILSSGRARKRGAAVHAILTAAADPATIPVAVADDVADELRRDEELFGGGAAGALKALRWLLLRHSFTSPLNEVTSDELESASLDDLLPLVERMKEDESGSKEFTVGATSDLVSVQNPAPRMSILQALARPDAFLPARGSGVAGAASREPGGETEEDASTPRQTRRSGAATADDVAMSGKTRRKRNTTSSPTTPKAVANGHADVAPVPAGVEEATRPFKEIEALYSMWQSAGKKINLWDWLEGFRDAVTHVHRAGANGTKDQNGGTDGERETTPTPTTPKRGKRKRDEVEEADGGDDEHARGEETHEVDEEEDARLHATFIRFVEESRMLGLVRGRGRGAGRRADEVAKGVLMV